MSVCFPEISWKIHSVLTISSRPCKVLKIFFQPARGMSKFYWINVGQDIALDWKPLSKRIFEFWPQELLYMRFGKRSRLEISTESARQLLYLLLTFELLPSVPFPAQMQSRLKQMMLDCIRN